MPQEKGPPSSEKRQTHAFGPKRKLQTTSGEDKISTPFFIAFQVSSSKHNNLKHFHVCLTFAQKPK